MVTAEHTSTWPVWTAYLAAPGSGASRRRRLGPELQCGGHHTSGSGLKGFLSEVAKYPPCDSTHPLSYQENSEDVLGCWKTEGQLGT